MAKRKPKNKQGGVRERRLGAIARLERTLSDKFKIINKMKAFELGYTQEEWDKAKAITIPLTEGDVKRINKEITTLRKKLQ